jgi:hypothetical protein
VIIFIEIIIIYIIPTIIKNSLSLYVIFPKVYLCNFEIPVDNLDFIEKMNAKSQKRRVGIENRTDIHTSRSIEANNEKHIPINVKRDPIVSKSFMESRFLIIFINSREVPKRKMTLAIVIYVCAFIILFS